MRRRDFFLSAGATLILPAIGLADALGKSPGVGIIFIGASWCPVCKNAAPVLAAMCEPVGIPVLVVSQDGRPIPPFPNITDGATHPIAAEVQALPTTLVFSQAKGDLTAQIVGYRNARHYAQSIQLAVLDASRG